MAPSIHTGRLPHTSPSPDRNVADVNIPIHTETWRKATWVVFRFHSHLTIRPIMDSITSSAPAECEVRFQWYRFEIFKSSYKPSSANNMNGPIVINKVLHPQPTVSIAWFMSRCMMSSCADDVTSWVSSVTDLFSMISKAAGCPLLLYSKFG